MRPRAKAVVPKWQSARQVPFASISVMVALGNYSAKGTHMATMVIGEGQHHVDFVGLKEIDLRRLARELAMGLIDPTIILESHGVDENRWVELCRNRRFLELLQDEHQTWYAAKNTRERIELKTWAGIEDALPQLFGYLHMPDFSDAAKVSLFSALQKQIGIGIKSDGSSDPGQKVTININTGTQQVHVEHGPDITPEVTEPMTIEAQPASPWRSK